MPFRVAPLAAVNILLVALILAVGLPGIFADAVRLPSEETINELQTGQQVARADDETASGRLGWADAIVSEGPGQGEDGAVADRLEWRGFAGEGGSDVARDD